MNILNKYQQLASEDKNNIIIYNIFNSIYDVLNEKNTVLNDDEIMNIEDLVYDLYIDDDCYNFSSSKIADFITKCYVDDNNFFNRIKDIQYDDILDAIDVENYNFYRNNNYER